MNQITTTTNNTNTTEYFKSNIYNYKFAIPPKPTKTAEEEEQQKQKFGAAIYAAEYKELQRIMDQEVVEFSNLLANLYQVTNMSRRLYFCLCYTKPRYSLSNT